LSFVPYVLPGRCDNNFSREVDSGNCFMGIKNLFTG
jgi:hypothetical protein